MTVDPSVLLAKHKSRGVLVDANLLILLLGTVNTDYIEKNKRTRAYIVADFDF